MVTVVLVLASRYFLAMFDFDESIDVVAAAVPSFVGQRLTVERYLALPSMIEIKSHVLPVPILVCHVTLGS